jgi:outer membrane protein assembly factor BamB
MVFPHWGCGRFITDCGQWHCLFGSDDHNLYALDAVSGQNHWSFQTGGKVQSSPTVVDGIVYVGSDDGKLYAIYA